MLLLSPTMIVYKVLYYFIYLSDYLYIYPLTSGIFICCQDIGMCMQRNADKPPHSSIARRDVDEQLEEFISLNMIPEHFFYLPDETSSKKVSDSQSRHTSYVLVPLLCHQVEQKSIQLLIFIKCALCARQFFKCCI